MTTNSPITPPGNKRWVNIAWKTTNYGLMAFSTLCGIMLFYGLGNWALHFDEWKEYRVKREKLAQEIVSTDEDKDVELERILGIPEDQTLRAKQLRKEMLKAQQEEQQQQQ